MSERLDIKNMMVEPEPPEPHRFDLDRDITPEQWQKIATEREHIAITGNWGSFASLAILESLHTGIPPTLSDEQWQEIVALPEEAYNRSWHNFTMLTALETLHTGTPPQLSPEQKQRLAAEREQEVAIDNRYGFADLAILEALCTGTPPTLSDEQWQEITTERKRNNADGYWVGFATLATLEALGSASKITLKPGGGITLEYDTPVETDDTPSPPQHRNF